MSNLNTDIALIEEALQAYKITDDFYIDPDVILATMNMVRSALLRQMKHSVDSGMYQLVDCLKIECISRKCEVNGYTLETEPLLKVVLPTLVSDMSPYDIKYLGGVDLQSGGTRLSLDGFANLQHSRFVKDKFHYTIMGNDCYLKNLPSSINKDTGFLSGMLLLHNPVDACNWNDETNYPCPSDYRLQVLTIQHILEGHRMKTDENNNAREQLNFAGGQPKQQQQQQTQQADE